MPFRFPQLVVGEGGGVFSTAKLMLCNVKCSHMLGTFEKLNTGKRLDQTYMVTLIDMTFSRRTQSNGSALLKTHSLLYTAYNTLNSVATVNCLT